MSASAAREVLRVELEHLLVALGRAIGLPFLSPQSSAIFMSMPILAAVVVSFASCVSRTRMNSSHLPLSA